MGIRLATPSDTDAMCDLVVKAFGDEGLQVSELVSEMVSSKDCLIWVAEDNGVKGLIGASKSALGDDSESLSWVLAPLGVEVDTQGTGVGSKLVHHLLKKATEFGIAAVFVYGDPDYYGRFGFSLHAAKNVKAPFDLEYPEGWLAIWFKNFNVVGHMQLEVKGPLNKPDLW